MFTPSYIKYYGHSLSLSLDLSIYLYDDYDDTLLRTISSFLLDILFYGREKKCFYGCVMFVGTGKQTESFWKGCVCILDFGVDFLSWKRFLKRRENTYGFSRWYGAWHGVFLRVKRVDMMFCWGKEENPNDDMKY